MANYKVIQDIEAEDKLVGPLTLRQFIYAGIAVVCGFLAFRLGLANVFLAFPFLPPVLFFGLLAAPFGHDQPNEVWLLAKVRFAFKPRKRIWDQSGTSELVTITAPKFVSRQLTKNFSRAEVSSHLEALASMIDSRGWAIKNVNLSLGAVQPTSQVISDNDRLLDSASMSEEVPNYDVSASDDIFDSQNNPTAQKLDQMSVQAEQAYKQKVKSDLSGEPKPQKSQARTDYWFLNNTTGSKQSMPAGFMTAQSHVVIPGDDPSATPQADTSDLALLQKLQSSKGKPNLAYGHTHVLQPLDKKSDNGPKKNQNPPQDSSVDPAIIGLALANKDTWSVATQAHQAEQATKKEPPEEEVVVSLR